MRIVAWNANYNGRRRSFDEDVAILAPLQADLVILSETAIPTSTAQGRIAWLGAKAPGLGLLANHGYTLVAHERNANAPPLCGAFQVTGPTNLGLLAAWPVRRGATSYARLLGTMLDHFADFLAQPHVALVGDLNSSSRVRSQVRSHPEFVARASALGLTSLYHYQAQERHGEESQATYRHRGSDKESFHIDYCFLSMPLLKGATIKVVDALDWVERSDHYPIVMDLPGGAAESV